MPKFIPASKLVLVKRDESKHTTLTGLYIPDSAKDTPQTGTVVAFSDESEFPAYPGDSVMFGKYAGTEVILERETYLLIEESEILGVFVEED